jgi:hypothetical protein
VPAHFVKYNQPGGFDALAEETRGFSEVAFRTATPSIEPGDRLVLFNTADKHLFAVVAVTGDGYSREAEDSDYPFAFPVSPELLSDRGPAFVEAPRYRSVGAIDDALFERCAAVVRLNRRREPLPRP